MPQTTIIADASYCPETKVGGWAAWAKTDEKPARRWRGQFKTEVEDSTAAELCAIANALHAATTAGLVPPGTIVMIQSDCSAALGYILANTPGSRESAHQDSARIHRVKPSTREAASREKKTVLEFISQKVREGEIKLLLRHVRGHQPGGGRQWVNRQCDQDARREMGEARAKHPATIKPGIRR